MRATLTDEEKIAVFRQMASHWQNKEWRRCADLFTQGGVLHSMMKDPIVGREAFYERMTQLATPNKSVKLHIHRIGVIDGACSMNGKTRSSSMVSDAGYRWPACSNSRGR
jgi:limonene-1,2-epoxide hydrolase